jgi:hypothetical protein
MDELDAVLLRLADPQERDALLGPEALLQLALVSYDLDAASVAGDVTAVYDRVDLGVPVPSRGSLVAHLSRASDPLPWELSAGWDDPGGVVTGADAVLSATLTLRTSGLAGTVEAVSVTQPDLDAAFAAALAGLPHGAPPQDVRTALRTAARTALDDPPLTQTQLDAILASVAGSGPAAVAGDAAADPRVLGRSRGGREALGVHLTMSEPPSPADAVPVALPVVAAFVLADATTGPRDLLRTSVSARRAASGYPTRQSPVGAPDRRTEHCVCWLLPASTFDDDGWPGAAGVAGATPQAQRSARLAAARAWLGRQGIAVVTT